MSLVRRNWSRTVDRLTYADGYPPALRYYFVRSAFNLCVNKVDNDFSAVLDGLVEHDYWDNKYAERRFNVVAFMRPGSHIRMCRGGDMSQNSVEITVTESTVGARCVTDSGLVAEASTPMPSEYLPNCRVNWQPVSLFVGRRGGNIEIELATFAGSSKEHTGKLLSKGGLSPSGCTLSGVGAHAVCIARYTSTNTPQFLAWDNLQSPRSQMADQNLLRIIYPRRIYKKEDMKTVCRNNELLEIFLSESIDRSPYTYRVTRKGPLGQEIADIFTPKYCFFGERGVWEAPENVRTVRATFISRGGWGSPAIKGITAASDREGSDGAEGRGYSRVITAKKCTLVIPPVFGVPPTPPIPAENQNGTWNEGMPLGGNSWPNVYESPPGCENEPVFKPEWFPYVVEFGQPQTMGELLETMDIRIGSYQAAPKEFNLVTWNGSYGTVQAKAAGLETPEKKNCFSDNLFAYGLSKKSRLKMQSGGAGIMGYRGRRESWMVDKRIVHYTFPPVPPGPGTIAMHYKF